MGVNKIKWDEANSIAQRIAEKAFEHLAEPIRARYENTLRTVHAELIARLGLGDPKKLIQAGVLEEIDIICLNFKQRDDCDDTFHAHMRLEPGEKLIAPVGYYHQFYVTDQDLVDTLRAITKEHAEFFDRVNALKITLCNQIQGKSAKHVMKIWPEAAQIVADCFCIDVITGADTKMTVPLEALLASFLTPQLAAPQGA